jgi:hypothetical protein
MSSVIPKPRSPTAFENPQAPRESEGSKARTGDTQKPDSPINGQGIIRGPVRSISKDRP